MTPGDEGLPGSSGSTGRSRALLDFQSEPQLILTGDGIIAQVNTALELISGSDVLLGRHWHELIVPEDADGQLGSAVEALLKDPQGTISPIDALWLGGESRRRISLRARSLPRGGAVVEISPLAVADIQSDASTPDGLQLPGRTGFESRLAEVIAQLREQGQSAVLCHIQIEQLKSLNAMLGHDVGGRLLQQLVQMLQRQLTSTDVLAQLDTDEFGLLIMEDLEAVRPWIEQLIDSSQRLQFLHGDRSYAVALSVGVVEVDADASDARTLMRRAAAACFEAMEPGGDRVIFESAGDQLPERRQAQLAVLGDIGRALDESHLTLFYEDVVQAQDLHAVVYRELLMRVRAPDGTLLSPGEFIQAAERYTLMNSIDRWVVREAFRCIAKLPQDNVVYAVNLSGQSLSDSRFLDFLKSELRNSGIAPQRLCFEITETGMVSRLVDAKSFVQEVSSLGCRFALDDFGSGMATFAYLRDFPVSYLKIDGLFVHNMLNSFVDRSIVESINRISHELGLLTIAEHVDQRLLAETLRDCGVDLLQGYAIQRAQPLSDLSK